MSELRKYFENARPLGVADPMTEPRPRETVDVLNVRRVRRGVIRVDVSVQPEEGDAVSLRFHHLPEAFYRKSGPRERIRFGLYRRARMEALDRAIQLAKGEEASGEGMRVSYSTPHSQKEYVTDMRVGPISEDSESLAFFASLLSREERVVAFTLEDSRVVRAPMDQSGLIDARLYEKLRGIAQAEFRRLGAPVKI